MVWYHKIDIILVRCHMKKKNARPICRYFDICLGHVPFMPFPISSCRGDLYNAIYISKKHAGESRLPQLHRISSTNIIVCSRELSMFCCEKEMSPRARICHTDAYNVVCSTKKLFDNLSVRSSWIKNTSLHYFGTSSLELLNSFSYQRLSQSYCFILIILIVIVL